MNRFNFAAPIALAIVAAAISTASVAQMPEQAQAGDLQTAGAPETPPSSTDALAASTPRGDTDTPAPLHVIPVPEPPEPLPKSARPRPVNRTAQVIVTATRRATRGKEPTIYITVIPPAPTQTKNRS